MFVQQQPGIPDSALGRLTIAGRRLRGIRRHPEPLCGGTRPQRGKFLAQPRAPRHGAEDDAARQEATRPRFGTC